MRTFAAFCISGCLALFSFIPSLTTTTEKKHACKSSHQSVKEIPFSAPGTTLTDHQALASLIVPGVSPVPASAPTPSTTTTTTAPPPPPLTLQTDTSGWQRVAICEEHGANDPVAGYFGILGFNWPEGESPANMDYAQQEQLAYSLNKGQVPWCPPNCAAGGYKGW